MEWFLDVTNATALSDWMIKNAEVAVPLTKQFTILETMSPGNH